MDKTIQKAGAIIVSKSDKNKIVLLHSGKQNDWSFPKGHIEEGEEPAGAMIREIKEETGLFVKILSELPDIYYTTPNGSAVSIKMFLVQSEDDTFLKPEIETDVVIWVPIKEASSLLSYDNLKEYLETVLSLIRK